MRKRSILAILALAGSVFSVTPAANAEPTALKMMTVEVHLANISGPGVMFVYLEIPKDISTLGIPQKLDDVPITTISLKSAGSLKVSIPVTKQVLDNTSSGLATFTFSAWFGRHRAVSEASIPVAPTPGNAAATMTDSRATIVFSPFEKVKPLGQPDPPSCEWTTDGKAVEMVNRIGQMQDSKGKGSQVKFNYSTSADSTFGVGISGSPKKGYTLSGNLAITDSMKGSGSFTRGRGFNGFVFGDFYRQRYRRPDPTGDPFCSPPFKAEFVKSVGDAFPGGPKLLKKYGQPKKDPFGRCGRDPNGKATVASEGSWDKDRAMAVTLSGSAQIFNLNVSGSTGFTNDINISYVNNGKGPEYLCGDAELPGSPILWSNNSQGR